MTVKELTNKLLDKELISFRYNYKGEDYSYSPLSYNEFIKNYGNYNVYGWTTYSDEIYITFDSVLSENDNIESR